MRLSVFLTAILGIVATIPCLAVADTDVFFRLAGDFTSNSAGKILEYQATDLIGSIDIEMIADIDGLPIYNFCTTLRKSTPSSVVLLSLLSYPAPGPASIMFTPTASNTGDILAANFGGGALAGPGHVGEGVILSTFRLDYDLTEFSTIDVTAEIGTLFWLDSAFRPAELRYANGPIINGGDLGAGGNTVIRIVPEPSSLGLLTIVILAVVRRRPLKD